MRSLLLAALASLALSACYFSVDWDGLAGTASPADAGGDGDVAVVDATTDATTDAPDASDAGIEASACPDGGFCDDFERTSVLGSWTMADLVTGGALSIASPGYLSNGALRTTLAADNGARAVVWKEFPASTSFRMRYLLFLGSTPARANSITPIGIGYSDRIEVLSIALKGTAISFVEQELATNGTQNAIAQSMPVSLRTKEWVEVILDVSLGSTGHAKLTYGGTVVSDANLANRYGADGFRVNIGSNYALAGDPVSFDIDDVQITWVPSK